MCSIALGPPQTQVASHIYANCVEEKNMILHIFMYNVISDFSAVTPASEGRVN